MGIDRQTRISRKKALSMDEVITMYIKSMKLSAGLNTQRIFAAWDDASGAGRYTLKKFFRDGKLYVTLNSSVVRNQLSFQKDALLEKVNDILAKDELFTKDDPRVSFVKELILK
ncbi:MAG: DUF721 domain-containing protein [Bacteroidia bacterium]|nr:DUF721 domain-containing protein [Bacteroidia bacterium]